MQYTVVKMCSSYMILLNLLIQPPHPQYLPHQTGNISLARNSHCGNKRGEVKWELTHGVL